MTVAQMLKLFFAEKGKESAESAPPDKLQLPIESEIMPIAKERATKISCSQAEAIRGETHS
jgi:hypothetical protein